MRHGFRVIVLLLAAGLVVLAAGCGGGSKKVLIVRTGRQATTTTQSGITPSGGSTFASAKNCLAFAGVAAKIASAMAPATASSGSDPQAVEREFQAFAAAAPSEVKGDF